MANIKVYYYDPQSDNIFSGVGESYELPPHATTTAPKQKQADGQFSYQYHFNETAQKWQERKTPLSQPETPNTEEP